MTVRQKLGLTTKKLRKSTQDSKYSCKDETKMTMKKITLKKANLNCIFKNLELL